MPLTGYKCRKREINENEQISEKLKDGIKKLRETLQKLKTKIRLSKEILTKEDVKRTVEVTYTTRNKLCTNLLVDQI